MAANTACASRSSLPRTGPGVAAVAPVVEQAHVKAGIGKAPGQRRPEAPVAGVTVEDDNRRERSLSTGPQEPGAEQEAVRGLDREGFGLWQAGVGRRRHGSDGQVQERPLSAPEQQQEDRECDQERAKHAQQANHDRRGKAGAASRRPGRQHLRSPAPLSAPYVSMPEESTRRPRLRPSGGSSRNRRTPPPARPRPSPRRGPPRARRLGP